MRDIGYPKHGSSNPEHTIYRLCLKKGPCLLLLVSTLLKPRVPFRGRIAQVFLYLVGSFVLEAGLTAVLKRVHLLLDRSPVLRTKYLTN